ncbi:MAG: Ada metal-binding domain-containing protein [Chloroflexota bacterium]|nr:Ada metal-binding domain-containing protein [Chloroflexota bacterium]MEC9321893.1 Ada metal-binding domain-containing protein [Chloroflexota bacterium]
MSEVQFNACITTNIVCRPNCPPGRRTKPENRRYFPSLTKAYRQGFRDCLVCKPSTGPPGPWIPIRTR